MEEDDDADGVDGSFLAEAERFPVRRQLPPLVAPQPAFQPGSTEGSTSSLLPLLPVEMA
jgi:hypothetical protein